MLGQLKAFLGGARHVARRTVPVAVLLVVAAGSAGAYSGARTAVHHGRRARSTFTLSATPARLSAAPGATVHYAIIIRRRRFTRRVTVTLLRRPSAGIAARFLLTRRRATRVTLTVRTSASMRPGRYRLSVRARAGHLTRALTLTLTITAAATGRAAAGQSPPFSLAGDIATPLEPGVSEPLDLRITNPNAAPLILTNADVGVQSVDAPQASTALPCGRENFGVTQLAGYLPLTIPASTTRSLSQLGIPPASWPQVTLLDLPTNQDGCRGALVALAYQGAARLG
jgi:hypothetical protein